ncbi:NACHT domain-containing protein [Mycobacteroides abscessus]|uniref:NACHT domain-containing protein n=1 Tax=Mycobacteroides abscessus TaxID=36809 RepID=UPI000D8A2DE5|nr:hypothetical protein [Mycobacteroides abscessus]SPX82469.1 Predicted NTPase (NACHT family) [Mycobacteroides abscessus]
MTVDGFLDQPLCVEAGKTPRFKLQDGIITDVHHNLEQLGPYGFQDLAAALAISEFGPQIQVMGPGSDGGRDMYSRAPVLWKRAAEQHGEIWDGYTVFQVKHKDRLASEPTRDAAWLWTQIRKELESWADPESNRDEVPNNLMIITNVPLTPMPRSGGEAQINANIENFIRSFDDDSRDIEDGGRERRLIKKTRIARLRQWRVWDGNQIDALLRVHEGVRRSFNAFLTAPDVFGHLAQFTDKLPLNELGPGLQRHARSTLIADRALHFDEAGSGDTAGTPIDKVAIDLPINFADNDKPRTVFGHILDRGERILKPSLKLHRGPRHIIVAGGPGNGKTTLSRFLVQIYRAAMLEGAPDLSSDHKLVIEGTARTLQALNLPGLPKHRRWPFRVDLAEYAKEKGLDEDSTLLRWIAHKVTKRLNLGTVSAGALDSWMRQWPWLLVLDGLDEVTEPNTRKRLIGQIAEFVSEAEADNCDLLVVLTTRPMGYVENIAPNHFERVDLSHLSTEQALAYGIKATEVRLGGDIEKIERIEQELRKAAENDALRNLMQTPLQVLIMTIIVEGAGSLAPDRYSLFWGYYDTVLRRERSKQTSFTALLRDHAPHILDLHQRVGFELQSTSETSQNPTATITQKALKNIAWNVLNDAGFHPTTEDAQLLDSIIRAATHRLVLLAPHGEEGYGFDVRSLQELMAARYLTNGPEGAVWERLRIAAAGPHWRNVWLFAAGQVFAEPQPHRHEKLVELVEQIDQDAAARLGLICPVGPALALDLVDDGMARAQPRFYDRLLRGGFRVLDAPELQDPRATARALVRAADIGDRTRVLVADAFRYSLSSTDTARATAANVQRYIEVSVTETGARDQIRGLSAIRSNKTRTENYPRTDPWDTYREVLRTFAPEEASAADRLSNADECVRGIMATGSAGDDAALIRDALSDEETAPVLEMALQAVASTEPHLVAVLRDEILPQVHRQPIGETLAHTIVPGCDIGM